MTINRPHDEAEEFSEGLAKVKLDDKYGYIDKIGKEIIPPKYSEVGDFSEGMARVKGREYFFRWGFVNKTGKDIIPLKYIEKWKIF
jgi:hypothetical protein